MCIDPVWIKICLLSSLIPMIFLAQPIIIWKYYTSFLYRQDSLFDIWGKDLRDLFLRNGFNVI